MGLHSFFHRVGFKIFVVNVFIYFILICYLYGDGAYRLLKNDSKTKKVIEYKFQSEKLSQTEPLVILIWTKFFRFTESEIWNFIERGMGTESDCLCKDSEKRFIISMNRSLYNQASAVVFHPLNTNMSDLPSSRRQDQLWVAFDMEPYAKNNHTQKIRINWKQFDGLFNWTMNFRRDSDVWVPYGRFVKNENIIPVEDIQMPGGVTLDQWISRNHSSHLMASVISHCHTQSNRERLIKRMKNRPLLIHTYGKCGDVQICHRFNQSCNQTEFWMELAQRYKFYFAAENTLCEDYVTEKFWRTLEIGMVPVVYGGANYKALAPKNSFIDISDFSSPKKLLKFLSRVANDNERYKQYFHWRSRYHIRWDNYWAGFCALCEKVANFKGENVTSKNSKYYDNLGMHLGFVETGNGLKSLSCSPPVFSETF